MLLESLLVLTVNVLFVRAAGQAIWGTLYRKAKPSLDNNTRLKQILSLAFSISVAILQIQLFLSTQDPNYYQTYNIKREYTLPELKAAHRQVLLNNHPDKNPDVSADKFQELKRINTIFQNEEKRQLYDRFGPFPDVSKDFEWENLKRLLQNQHFMSFVLFYMVANLIILIQTYHRDLREARIRAIVMIAAFGYNEWCQINDQNYPIILSKVYGSLGIFQLVMIQRIILTMLLVGLILYKRCLVRGMEWINQTLQYCRNCDDERKLGFLKEVTLQLRVIDQQQLKQNTSQNSRFQKFINFFVMLIMLFFMITHFYLPKPKEERDVN